MKVLILAGGQGTRISEESRVRPKPLVQIGGKPILWHIMKTYSHYGFNDFVVMLGYLGYSIKEYFANYFLHQSDVRFDFASNERTILSSTAEDWKVTLIDTGADTLTGGRIKRVRSHIGDDPFMLTYGDGVANIDLLALKEFHGAHNGLVTMTSIQPESRYGVLTVDSSRQVTAFKEKAEEKKTWINGGFFVCDPQAIDYIPDDHDTMFEREPLERLAADGGLYTYHHHGFWHCMDTLRDKNRLEEMWDAGTAPWKMWSDSCEQAVTDHRNAA